MQGREKVCYIQDVGIGKGGTVAGQKCAELEYKPYAGIHVVEARIVDIRSGAIVQPL